ncbi:hypothetical protein FZEAL_313 [Fusarium zealandicum]|uniref:Uncharacterized protein n=1 Tax=Fusarium zealandicum TaxID=1053134 RepID=A0A8H4UV27_9HYPO|nr:hypothetical protein FZEAL_313 [Fusarium zealandicum]
MPSESFQNDPPNSSRNPRDFFSWLATSYDDDKPHGSIDEIYGQSADINKGFGGKYVWLTVHRASNARLMADNIWIDIRGSSIDNRNDDLASGAGGDYRYLQWSNNMAASHFVTDVGLWRSDDSQDDPPNGWHHKSADINRGRGGDYLYLVWRTKQFIGPKN